MDTQSTTATPARAAANDTTADPTAAHHSRLDRFLAILLALAPAIAAPLVPAGRGQEILKAETPIAQTIAQILAQE